MPPAPSLCTRRHRPESTEPTSARAGALAIVVWQVTASRPKLAAEPAFYFRYDLGVSLVDLGIRERAVVCPVHHSQRKTRVRGRNGAANKAIEEGHVLGQVAGSAAHRALEVTGWDVVAHDDGNVTQRGRETG
jgi:hypothetical protein